MAPKKRSQSAASSTDPRTKILNRLKTSVPRRLLEPTALLHALDPVRGQQIRTEYHDSDSAQGYLLRQFLDSISYVCDTDRGSGASVTAAALEGGGTAVLWLAANTDLKEKLVEDVRWVLELAKEAYGVEDAGEYERRIFEKVTELGKNRIMAYRKAANALVRTQLASKRTATAGNDSLRALLERIQRELSTYEEVPLHSFVRRCHDICRNDPDIRLIKSSENNGLKTIYHNFALVGKHLSVTRKILAAANGIPQLFTDIEVKVLKSSVTGAERSPLDMRPPTAEGIMGRMFSDPEQKKSYLSKLQELDDLFGLGIEKSLSENCKGTTRVHAELLLVDHFCRGGLQFFDNTPYIGCSKPACYLCKLYVQAHSKRSHQRIELGRSHQKLYLAWRAPDLPEHCDTEYAWKRNKILDDMTQEVRNEVIKHLDNRSTRNRTHPDSTTGVSTLTSSGPMELNFHNLSLHNSMEQKTPTQDQVLGNEAAELNSENPEEDYAFSDDSNGDDAGRVSLS